MNEEIKKKLFLLFIFIFVYSILPAQDPEPLLYPFENFSGGINTKTSSLLINPSETPDCNNVWYDETDTLSKRYGYDIYCNLPSTCVPISSCEYTRSSGERWLVVETTSAGNTASIYASDNNGLTWTLWKSGLATINPVRWAMYIDKLWGTNGFNDVFSFNGSTVTTYDYIPKGKYILVHYSQMFLANTPDNASAVYFNDTYRGVEINEGWDSLDLGRSDGDEIIGLVSHGDNIVVFKKNSTYGILGYGTGMSLYKYPGNYGCVSDKTIQKFKGDILFLSKKGLCAFNNGLIKQVDRKVEDITKNATVIAGLDMKKSWIQMEKDDFALGISSDVDINTHPGEMHIPYFEPISWDTANKFPEDNKKFDWQMPPLGQAPHSALLAKPISPFQIRKMKIRFYVYDWFWFRYGDWYSYYGIKSSTWTLKIERTDTNTIIAQDTTLLDPEIIETQDIVFFSTWSFVVPTISPDLLKVTLHNDNPFLADTFEAIFPRALLYLIVGQDKVAGQTTPMAKEDFLLSVRYEFFTSTKTSGYFISQKKNVGTAIQSWQHFIASQKGDALSYFIKVATGTEALDTIANWTSITNGSIISATTSQHWIQWKSSFTNTNQSLYSVRINWLEGSADYQDCSSAVFDNRYYLSIATYGFTNNTIIGIDNNGAFYRWDIPVSHFISYYNKLLFTKSTPKGDIYEMFKGYNDNGVAIPSNWKSKYLDVGSDKDKSIVGVGITAKGSGTLWVGYRSNYETNFTSFPVTLTTEPDNFVEYFTAGLSRAKYWQLSIENNNLSEYFDIIRFNLYYFSHDLRSR